MRILVNYIYNKKEDKFEILEGKYVLADQKFAVMDNEREYKEPIVIKLDGVDTVLDKVEYSKTHRVFRLITDEKTGKVLEHPEGSPIWLPIETDVNKLVFINGQLLLREDEPAQPEHPKEEKAETPKEEKPKSKSKK